MAGSDGSRGGSGAAGAKARAPLPAREIDTPLPPRDLAAPLTARAARALAAGALAGGRVRIALQPVVQARAPERPAFHEALLRLLDTDGRPIPAGRFIAAVETGPLGRALDRAALGLGLGELAARPELRLSVNVAPASLADPAWLALLRRGLAGDPTLGERLILEITERGLVPDASAIAATLNGLRPLGVSFALDDFGAGATAMAHLRDLRFDILKIDGRFARRVAEDRDNQALMRAMLSLGAHFEMLTVAEAVERQADAAWLAAAGADALQGHAFGHPVLSEPAEAAAIPA